MGEHPSTSTDLPCPASCHPAGGLVHTPEDTPVPPRPGTLATPDPGALGRDLSSLKQGASCVRRLQDPSNLKCGPDGGAQTRVNTALSPRLTPLGRGGPLLGLVS